MQDIKFRGGLKTRKKHKKYSLSEQKKFGRNYATLIFALPKRNKGSKKRGKIGKLVLRH
jgi:hypothetical protein